VSLGAVHEVFKPSATGDFRVEKKVNKFKPGARVSMFVHYVMAIIWMHDLIGMSG
jgi:hypothetical protein